MATQQEIVNRMVTQLKLLDNSISAEIGTPERKIIETVAQVLAESQVDINMLNGAFDIEAKYGDDLEAVLSIFGFGRQQGSRASGFVTFTRDQSTAFDIIISAGTQVFAPDAYNGLDVIFVTTRSVTLAGNASSVVAPVDCIMGGEIGNVAANTITAWNQNPIVGISSFTNESPIVGGSEIESDASLKARFKSSGPFRNLAGTKDQFLALALATKATKANVVGPISKYKEYIQVPSESDDNTTTYTTSLSTNVNSKHVYSDLPFFVMKDTSGFAPTIFNEKTDFIVNIYPEAKNRGDALRDKEDGGIDPLSDVALNRPNVTFLNVSTSQNQSIQTVKEGDILLFEHSYISTASRNDYQNKIFNCVDVYINNDDPVAASTVISRPGSNSSPVQKFNTDLQSHLNIENYRRMGTIVERPVAGNIFVPVLRQPMIKLPESITLSTGTLKKGVHYWEVEDATPIRGTIRARNGIEFASQIRSKADSDAEDGPYYGQYIDNASSQQTILSWSINNSIQNIVIVDANSIPAEGTIYIDNEQLLYKKNTDGYTNYNGTGTTQSWDPETSYAGTKISSEITSTATTISVVSSTNISNNEILLINSELVQVTAVNNNDLTVTRGYLGTTPSPHAANAIIGNYAFYKGVIYQRLVSGKTTVTPDLDSINWAVVGYSLLVSRAANNTTAASHSQGTAIKLPWDNEIDTIMNIVDYYYDANIVNLQASLEGSKQITTDVLAHRSKVRYFKPDITVMYISGANPSDVNENIVAAVENYFNNQYYGSTIQLSDILQAIHNAPGVDNVRWTLDNQVLNGTVIDSEGAVVSRLKEVKSSGSSLETVLQQTKLGDYTTYVFYLTEGSTSGELVFNFNSQEYTFEYFTQSGDPSNYVDEDLGEDNTPAVQITATLIDELLDDFANVTAIDPNSPPSVNNPYTITYKSFGDVRPLSLTHSDQVVNNQYQFNEDFMLGEDELAALPTGLTDANGNRIISSIINIRRKAQSTWNRS